MADPEYTCSTATGYRESRVKDRKIELKDTTKLKNNVKSVCNILPPVMGLCPLPEK